jgi:predicted metalloprotease with PDZ domain
MLPYDYTRENYSRLGYVYEGVTTYMGDKFLFSSTVIDEEQYFKELQTYMERHIHNGGRFNLSVTDSSYDTWLDGYQSGVPDRKTSIYAEGCLFSFILDVALISSPNSAGGLDDVLKRMYIELAGEGVGYTQEDYIRISCEVAGRDISELFESLVETPVDYGEALMNAFEQIGLEFSIVDDRSWVRKFGLKGTYSNGKYKVTDVAFESDAYTSNVIRGDQIVSVNGYTIDENLDNWLAYFGKEKQELGVVRDGKYRGIIADPEFTNGFQKCKIKHVENKTESQKQNFEKWLNK